MAPTIVTIRSELAKTRRTWSGEEGERFAAAWMRKVGWQFEPVDQAKSALAAELRRVGGKRPDFFLDPQGTSKIVLLDAKYHSTGGGLEFVLTDFELLKYDALVKYMAASFHGHEVELLFMLFPREFGGSKLLFVSLDEMLDGALTELDGEPARRIAIDQRLNDPGVAYDC